MVSTNQYENEEQPKRSKHDEIMLQDQENIIQVTDLDAVPPGEFKEIDLAPYEDSAGGQKSTHGEDSNENDQMLYKLEDIPSWFATIFLGFQVYLMMAGTTVSLPFVLAPKLCMADDDKDKANVVATFVFISGLITILQTSFGTRLPIVQGGSTAFLIPSLAILALDKWKCPEKDEIMKMTSGQRTELWQVRIREIQGAIICASIFQVIFGFCGLIGLILRFITPMTVAPSIAMIGLSLFGIAGGPASTNWAVSIPTVFLMILFSQYFQKYKIPIPFTHSPKRNGPMRYRMFQSLPILFAMAVMWIICAILTAANMFPIGNLARTDIRNNILDESDWFRVPYPFQWGLPTVTAGAVMGMLAGVIAGIVESIGDYYACARIVGVKAPPLHAVNRGIFIEGIGCILAGMWGTGNGTTSYSENIGAIGVTQTGSRRITQIGGLIMIVFSLFGKLNAVFVSIPEPIIGAFLIVVFSIVTAVGLSNLKGVDLNSPRNIFIIGFSIFFALTISQWMRSWINAKDDKGNLIGNKIDIGNESLSQMLQIFLSTGMFLGGLTGFILDNTIPGTRKQRGLIEWEEQFKTYQTASENIEDPYDLPFVTFYLKQYSIAKWIPISPTFEAENYKQLVIRLIQPERIRQQFSGLFQRRRRATANK